MKARQTPQEKKIADYKNQRRNHYGENSKSSRKAIRKRKRWVNKSYRKRIKNITDSLDSNQMDIRVANVTRGAWQKHPDILLIDDLDTCWSGSSRTRTNKHASSTRKEAIKRLKKSRRYDR